MAVYNPLDPLGMSLPTPKPVSVYNPLDPMGMSLPGGMHAPAPSTQDRDTTPNPGQAPWTGGVTGAGVHPTSISKPGGSSAPSGGGGDFGAAWTRSGGRTLDDFRRFAEQWNTNNPNDRVSLGGSKGDKATYRGRTYDAVIAAGLGGQGASWYDITDGEGPGGGGGGGAPGGAPSTASSVFSDPATTGWEQLLRQLVDRMNVPQPTWTPAQLELQQTQALDPLERQRQAQRQQMGQRLASRGIAPGSGVFESALADIDRQFNQLRTQTQGAFATRAIDREDQVFKDNEARAANAVNFMRQIPQLADQRLATARGTLIDSNPYQLLQLQQQIERDRMAQQQYQDAQNQQFWAQIANILAQAF